MPSCNLWLLCQGGSCRSRWVDDRFHIAFSGKYTHTHTHAWYWFINTERDVSGSLSRPFATTEVRDEPLNWLVTSCLTRRFRKLTRIADESRFDNSSCHIITSNMTHNSCDIIVTHYLFSTSPSTSVPSVKPLS